jgi:hypothetical protein
MHCFSKDDDDVEPKASGTESDTVDRPPYDGGFAIGGTRYTARR